MQITLNNQEINTAIEQYVRHLISLANNTSMTTEITGSRGEYKVIVEILPTKTTEVVETKRVGRPPKVNPVIVEPKQEEVQTDTVVEEEEEVIEVVPAAEEEEPPTPKAKTSLFKNLNK